MKKDKTLYDMFRKNKKMKVDEILSWLDIKLEYQVAELDTCWLRVIGDGNIVEFSEPKDRFDRWALSDGLLFDLKRNSDRRSFINHLESMISF